MNSQMGKFWIVFGLEILVRNIDTYEQALALAEEQAYYTKEPVRVVHVLAEIEAKG